MQFPPEPASPDGCGEHGGGGDDDSDGRQGHIGDRDDVASQGSARSTLSSKARLKMQILAAPLVEEEALLPPCKGCGQAASDTNQWVQYDPVFDDGNTKVVVAKKPKGRVCRLCLTTYSAAGWDATYGPIGNYFRFANTPPGRAKHQEFLHKRKVMAGKVEAEGHFPRGEGAKKVGRAELLLKKSRGSKVLKAARDFVCLDAWDEKLDGVLDKTKITKEDFGEGIVEGCWVARGRRGVFQEQGYLDSNMEESRFEADDSGPFGKERFANKRKHTAKVFDDTDSKRQKLEVERPASGLVGVADASSLLALLQSAASGSGLPGAPGEPDAAGEQRGGWGQWGGWRRRGVRVRGRWCGSRQCQ